MKVLIKITKEVLQRSLYCGTRMNMGEVNKNYAIANAVRDLFPEAYVLARAIVFSGDIQNYLEWDRGDGPLEMSRHALLPREAETFIYEFDSLAPKYESEYQNAKLEKRLLLPEFSFEIDVPEEVIQSIGINQVFKILSESPTLEHVNP